MVTGGPGQPEFSSFEAAGSGHTVHELTGDLTYQDRIITIPGPGGTSYSMSLFYHSGITADQVASWCGLGWNINAGSISRTVVDNPDDWNNAKSYVLAYD